MRLGLICDIHEHIEYLQQSLDCFADYRVDRIVAIGDLFETGERIEVLWYYEGPPDEPAKLARIFAAVPHPVMFSGHYHRWLWATSDGITDWTGQTRLCLGDSPRSFVVVGALCEGRFATFDTQTLELEPFNLRG